MVLLVRAECPVAGATTPIKPTTITRANDGNENTATSSLDPVAFLGFSLTATNIGLVLYVGVCA